MVGPGQLPAAPLLDDPLPVLDHLLGQADYPAQGAAGEGLHKHRQINLLRREPFVVGDGFAPTPESLDGRRAEALREPLAHIPWVGAHLSESLLG